jgi:hypothetical protein
MNNDVLDSLAFVFGLTLVYGFLIYFDPRSFVKQNVSLSADGLELLLVFNKSDALIIKFHPSKWQSFVSD